MRRFRFADHLLLFDPPVLEPDGDLALREVRGGGDAPALLFGNELAGRVFLLQLLQLHLGIRHPFLAPTTVAAHFRL